MKEKEKNLKNKIKLKIDPATSYLGNYLKEYNLSY